MCGSMQVYYKCMYVMYVYYVMKYYYIAMYYCIINNVFQSTALKVSFYRIYLFLKITYSNSII